MIWVGPPPRFAAPYGPGGGAGKAAAHRAARRAAAGLWLAREGIGLATVA